MVPPLPRTYAGGAQRGISLATGTFTGESRRNPPAARFWKTRLIINPAYSSNLVFGVSARPGDTIAIRPDADAAHLFDATTEQRID